MTKKEKQLLHDLIVRWEKESKDYVTEANIEVSGSPECCEAYGRADTLSDCAQQLKDIIK